MSINGSRISTNGRRRWDIFSMLESTEGHEMLVRKLRCYLQDAPWGAIDHMIMALERGEIFIPTFSTVVNVQANG